MLLSVLVNKNHNLPNSRVGVHREFPGLLLKITADNAILSPHGQ